MIIAIMAGSLFLLWCAVMAYRLISGDTQSGGLK